MRVAVLPGFQLAASASLCTTSVGRSTLAIHYPTACYLELWRRINLLRSFAFLT